jgi:hypothetical protein
MSFSSDCRSLVNADVSSIVWRYLPLDLIIKILDFIDYEVIECLKCGKFNYNQATILKDCTYISRCCKSCPPYPEPIEAWGIVLSGYEIVRAKGLYVSKKGNKFIVQKYMNIGTVDGWEVSVLYYIDYTQSFNSAYFCFKRILLSREQPFKVKETRTHLKRYGMEYDLCTEGYIKKYNMRINVYRISDDTYKLVSYYEKGAKIMVKCDNRVLYLAYYMRSNRTINKTISVEDGEVKKQTIPQLVLTVKMYADTILDIVLLVRILTSSGSEYGEDNFLEFRRVLLRYMYRNPSGHDVTSVWMGARYSEKQIITLSRYQLEQIGVFNYREEECDDDKNDDNEIYLCMQYIVMDDSIGFKFSTRPGSEFIHWKKTVFGAGGCFLHNCVRTHITGFEWDLSWI